MSLIIISNREGCDWTILCNHIGNENQSSVIALDNSCKPIKYLKNDAVGLLPEILFINEKTLYFDDIFYSIEVGEEPIYVAVHSTGSINNDFNPPPNTCLYEIYQCFEENNNHVDIGKFEFFSFNHEKENIIWSKIDILIKSIIKEDHSAISSAKSDILNKFNDLSKERRAVEVKFSLSDLLLPLATYDLLMQTGVTDQLLHNAVKEESINSLNNLKDRFSDIVNKYDFDFEEYNEEFHYYLKKLSSELLK